MATETIGIRYHFTFEDGTKKTFEALLDARTLCRVNVPSFKERPAWTSLECHQCANCPLRPETDPFCPAAVAMIDVVELFDAAIMRRVGTVRIETPERTYEKHTNLQEALSSLIGLCMASSGCPKLEKLRPMVAAHLPFATPDETLYRVMSMYLIAQYLVSRRQGGKADWELKDLAAIYEDLHTVNTYFHQRLSEAHGEDATPAAVVMLELLSQSMSFAIGDHEMAPLEAWFAPYLKPSAEKSA